MIKKFKNSEGLPLHKTKNQDTETPEKIRLAIGCTFYIFSEALKSMLEKDKFIKVEKIFARKPNLILSLDDIREIKSEIFLTDYNTFVDARYITFTKIPDSLQDDRQIKIILLVNTDLDDISISHLRVIMLVSLEMGLIINCADIYMELEV